VDGKKNGGGLVKWIIIALAVAATLIGIGMVAAGSRDHARVSRNPKAVHLCDEGTADLHAFRLRAAVEKLGQCLQEDPSLAEASISRTLAFLQLGERENMKRELSRADSLTAALKDERRRLVAELRLSTLGGSRFVAMRDSLYKVLQVEDPDNIHVLVAGAERAARTRDDAAVEKAWLRILEKDPNYANSYNMLGYLELNRGNYDQAIEHMQKYAFLAPDLANPHDSLGEVYMALGRYEEAEKEFVTSVTMQPDFYHSLINLGKVYLARGELRRGLELLENIRDKVAGTELEMRVDREIISTYLKAGMNEDLARATARFVANHTKDDASAVYRAVHLTYLGRTAEGRAVMDSSLAAWRAAPPYNDENREKARQGVESTANQFDGIVADIAGDHARAAESWAAALRILQPGTGRHELFYLDYRLAEALRLSGRPREALAQVDPVLAINPRLPESLLLKVRCHLELGQTEAARQTLTQLEWTLAKADADLPVVAETAALRRRLGAATAASAAPGS
jgi:tetratricopeptide (TPR) repeat protein